MFKKFEKANIIKLDYRISILESERKALSQPVYIDKFKEVSGRNVV